MKAAYLEEHGGPEVIKVGELPEPVLAPGHVMVRVSHVALNPIDLYLRSGLVKMPMAFPYVIGCDFAGSVVGVGSEASRFRVGDRVWGSNQGLLGRPGAASELASVREDLAYGTPSDVTDRDAAAMALTGITAHLGLFRNGRLAAGESVYVSGGSGGVGTMVIQMAKAAGARVATTAGSAEKLELCRRLGAECVIDYKTDDVAGRIHEFAPEGVDVWFETQREPNLEVAIPLLRKRGRMIVMAGRQAKPLLPLGAFYPKDCTLSGFAMFNATPEEQAMAAREINEWSGSGRLKAVVAREFPIDDAAAAERFLEESTLGGAGKVVGKVMLRVS
jgi:NADPH2:quinone reductase